MEEGEIETMASLETARPSSQRFIAKTPQDVSGSVGISLRAPSSPKFGMEDSDLGGGAAGDKVDENLPKDGARAA